MSAIADFRLLQKSILDELESVVKPKKGLFGGIKDNYFKFLNDNSSRLNEYKWSGFIFGTLLVYLQENSIDLMESHYNELSKYITESRGSTCFIFTEEHKLKFIEKLNPAHFNKDELKEYYNDFNETDENDIGQAMLDGIKVLYENIQRITSDTVIIFGIC